MLGLNLNSLLVHTRLENRLGHLERLWIAGFDFSFQESPHLHIQLVPKDGEHRGSCPIVRNDGLLYEAATGELVEVVAWVRRLVQLVQQVRSSLDASLQLIISKFSSSLYPSNCGIDVLCARKHYYLGEAVIVV